MLINSLAYAALSEAALGSDMVMVSHTLLTKFSSRRDTRLHMEPLSFLSFTNSSDYDIHLYVSSEYYHGPTSFFFRRSNGRSWANRIHFKLFFLNKFFQMILKYLCLLTVIFYSPLIFLAQRKASYLCKAWSFYRIIVLKPRLV